MNAEIYSIRSSREELQSLNKALPAVIDELRESNVNILYKTEMDLDREKLLQGIHQSLSSKDDIELIVITNALDGKEGNAAFDALCGLSANHMTPDRQRLLELHEEGLPDLVMAMDYPAVKKEEEKEDLLAPAYCNARSIGDMGGGCEGYCFFCYGKKVILLPKESLTGIPVAQMVKQGVYFALTNSPLPDSELTSKGVCFIPKAMAQDKKKNKKKGFWSGVIPMKGDSKKEIARKIVLIAASLTFLITAGYLFNYLVIQPMLADQNSQEINNVGNIEEPIKETDPKTGEVTKTISHDWAELKKVNKDIAAWLKIDDTEYLDYPVLQSKTDNISTQKYLYTDYKGNYSGYGSLFIDYRSKQGADSKNVIIHGHHMNDGRMFAGLMGYGRTSGDLGFYKKHPTIHFDTPDGDAEWKIISVYKTNTLEDQGKYFDYLTGTFASDAEFMNYVYLIRERSLFDIPVDVNEKDQLLTLSTCSYEFSEFRTIVVARKVRKGESSKVDLTKAKLNPDPLWPDVYYNTYGGSKPKVTSFSKAYKAGEIDWYDGKGKLKGKERAFTLYDNVKEKETEPETEATKAPTAAPVQKIANINIFFDKQSVTMNVGDQEKITVQWNPLNTSDKTLKWYNSNTNVVSVTSSGLITAVGPGTATIQVATKEGHTAKCTVKVIQPPTSISLNWASYNLNVGTSVQLKAIVSPSNASAPTVKWRSSNTAVASVDANGKVTARGAGSTTITAETGNGLTASCTVRVYAPAPAPSSSEPETTAPDSSAAADGTETAQ